jgi:hypothetical protein
VTDLASVQNALEMLAAVQEDLAVIATRSDDRRKNDLIVLRRQLALKIAEVGRIVEPVINGIGDPDLLRTYREKLSRMRSAAAMHQANWPAVKLGEQPEEYNASAVAVRDANRDFVAWMRGILVMMR